MSEPLPEAVRTDRLLRREAVLYWATHHRGRPIPGAAERPARGPGERRASLTRTTLDEMTGVSS